MTLLAKSDGETLYNHSILVYESGIKIIDNLPFEKEEREKLRSLSSIPLLFHDIGKGAIGFQRALIEGGNWKGKRHEIISSALISKFNLSDEQIFSVITHHKDILNSMSNKTLPENQISQEDGDTATLKQMKLEFNKNKNEIAQLINELLDYLKVDMDIETELYDGIGIDKVWLNGSYGYRYGQMVRIDFQRRKLASMLRGIVKAADHLASSHNEYLGTFNIKEVPISKYKPRYFQRRCKEKYGDMMLIAPTGSGKTEAALYWAQNNYKENSRLFYVLPYQASINAMYQRLGEVFPKENIGVLHSDAVSFLYSLQNEDEADIKDKENETRNMASLAKEIYYQIRVCTPQQLLKFGLKGKGWEYLYLELSNSLLIYDEIHAFQPQLVGLTLATAKLLKDMGARLCFASATFPDFLKALINEKLGKLEQISPAKEYDERYMDLEEYKLDEEVVMRKRHNIRIVDGSLIDNLDKITNIVESGKSVLIIANHVKTAQRLFEALEAYQPMLLHSRFNRADRRQKEKLLISENKPNLVIATQVIEVSLDIDYEVMFTEPAPIDALVQRFGRVNRKGQRYIGKDIPENVFVMFEQVSKHNLYYKERIDKTLQLLSEIQVPISEMELLDITNKVYEDGYNEDELEQFNLGFNNPEILEFNKNLIAGVSRIWVDDIMNKSDGSCEVLPLEYWDEYENLIEDGKWIEAKDLLVNVRYSLIFDKITNKDEKNPDVYMVDCKYSHEKGLLTEERNSNMLGFD